MIERLTKTPSKIVALGLNYRDHAEEFNLPIPEEPIIFMKPATAVIFDGDDIVYPEHATRVDYEAELAIVIGREAKNVPAELAKRRLGQLRAFPPCE